MFQIKKCEFSFLIAQKKGKRSNSKMKVGKVGKWERSRVSCIAVKAAAGIDRGQPGFCKKANFRIFCNFSLFFILDFLLTQDNKPGATTRNYWDLSKASFQLSNLFSRYWQQNAVLKIEEIPRFHTHKVNSKCNHGLFAAG